MARSGWVAVAVALVLVAALGSGPARDAAVDAERGVQPLASSLTAFPSWDGIISGDGSDITISIVVKLLVLVVGLFLLAAVAGRAGSMGAAFLAGWGAFVVASAMAAAVFSLLAENLVFDGFRADSEGGALAPLARDINAGAAFGLYTGALVGVAVALTRRVGTPTLEPEPPFAMPPTGSAPAGGPPFGPPGAVPPVGGGSAGGSPGPVPPGVANGEPGPPPMPVATWPPSPNLPYPPSPPSPPSPSAVGGTVPPSPAWVPPPTQSPLPAAPLPRRAVGSRPVPSLPADPAESLDSTKETRETREQDGSD